METNRTAQLGRVVGKGIRSVGPAWKQPAANAGEERQSGLRAHAGWGRNRWLSTLALVAFVLFKTPLPVSSAAAAPQSPPRRPNILFIMADDHTSQAWACYGSRLAPYCPTSNIDRLAREGVLLQSCFCTNSICVPSRAAILTGQYSHVNGVRTLRDALDPKADNVAKRLQQAGYQTALIGKWHLKKPPSGFDYWNIIKGQGRYHDPVMFEMDLKKPHVERGYSTDVFTDKALQWLDRRDKTRPFCLMLHFKATHEPWQFDSRFASLLRDVELPEPETLLGPTGPIGSRVPGWPLEILTQRMTKDSKHGGYRLVLDTNDPVAIRKATYQKFVRDYLRCVAGINENLGRVLDYLDQHGLTQDTLVIYTSDQGYFLGEHNYFDKRFMLEESLRMPFVARYPREIPAGTVNRDIILNIDFAPTFLDYAGVKPPPSMQGRSFRSNLAGKTPPDWRDAMYYRYFENSRQRPAHFGIRTHRFKLIYYDGLTGVPEERRWELYDLEKDPHETRNRYDDPEYAPVIADLKKRLFRLQAELGDRP